MSDYFLALVEEFTQSHYVAQTMEVGWDSLGTRPLTLTAHLLLRGRHRQARGLPVHCGLVFDPQTIIFHHYSSLQSKTENTGSQFKILGENLGPRVTISDPKQ